jgi:hypothetical protein
MQRFFAKLRYLAVPGVLALAVLVAASGQEGAPKLSNEQQEEFLRKGKVLRHRSASKGITDTKRATLEHGGLVHDASVQTIDESKAQFTTPQGTEINFRDSYKFNIAAYKLGLMLGLDSIPVSVERPWQGTAGSYTWWVDDVLMDELQRTAKKTKPPDQDRWNCQMHQVRVFDQLIFNTDRNLGNLLIDKNWKIWMIDHSRAFRQRKDLREVKNLEKCDRKLLAKLKELNREDLTRELGRYITKLEIDGLLARRDKIVAIFEGRGEVALYDSISP